MVVEFRFSPLVDVTVVDEFEMEAKLISKSSRWVYAGIDFATTQTERQGHATTNRYAIHLSQ